MIGLGEIPSFDDFDPHDLLQNIDGNKITMVPALVMAVLASRGVILWVKNLIMLIVIFFAARSFVKEKVSLKYFIV